MEIFISLSFNVTSFFYKTLGNSGTTHQSPKTWKYSFEKHSSPLQPTRQSPVSQQSRHGLRSSSIESSPTDSLTFERKKRKRPHVSADDNCDEKPDKYLKPEGNCSSSNTVQDQECSSQAAILLSKSVNELDHTSDVNNHLPKAILPVLDHLTSHDELDIETNANAGVELAKTSGESVGKADFCAAMQDNRADIASEEGKFACEGLQKAEQLTSHVHLLQTNSVNGIQVIDVQVLPSVSGTILESPKTNVVCQVDQTKLKNNSTSPTRDENSQMEVYEKVHKTIDSVTSNLLDETEGQTMKLSGGGNKISHCENHDNLQESDADADQTAVEGIHKSGNKVVDATLNNSSPTCVLSHTEPHYTEEKRALMAGYLLKANKMSPEKGNIKTSTETDRLNTISQDITNPKDHTLLLSRSGELSTKEESIVVGIESDNSAPEQRAINCQNQDAGHHSNIFETEGIQNKADSNIVKSSSVVTPISDLERLQGTKDLADLEQKNEQKSLDINHQDGRSTPLQTPSKVQQTQVNLLCNDHVEIVDNKPDAKTLDNQVINAEQLKMKNSNLDQQYIQEDSLQDSTNSTISGSDVSSADITVQADGTSLKKLVPEVCACDTTTGSTDDELGSKAPKESLGEESAMKSNLTNDSLNEFSNTSDKPERNFLKRDRSQWGREMTKIRIKMRERKRLSQQAGLIRARQTRRKALEAKKALNVINKTKNTDLPSGLKSESPTLHGSKSPVEITNVFNVANDEMLHISVDEQPVKSVDNPAISADQIDEKAVIPEQISDKQHTVTVADVEKPELAVVDESDQMGGEDSGDTNSKALSDGHVQVEANLLQNVNNSSNVEFESIEIVDDEEEESDPWPFSGSPAPISNMPTPNSAASATSPAPSLEHTDAATADGSKIAASGEFEFETKISDVLNMQTVTETMDVEIENHPGSSGANHRLSVTEPSEDKSDEGVSKMNASTPTKQNRSTNLMTDNGTLDDPSPETKVGLDKPEVTSPRREIDHLQQAKMNSRSTEFLRTNSLANR